MKLLVSALRLNKTVLYCGYLISPSSHTVPHGTRKSREKARRAKKALVLQLEHR